jgi:purine-nucleoside phosphorylase
MSVHIEAKAGEIADKILLPGDPLRAKYIAETFLEDPVCYNNVRGNARLYRCLQRGTSIRTRNRYGDAFCDNLCP